MLTSADIKQIVRDTTAKAAKAARCKTCGELSSLHFPVSRNADPALVSYVARTNPDVFCPPLTDG